MVTDKLSQQWSVVMLGRWNRSILTPFWIGKNLFGINEGEGLKVQVPLDIIAPFLVSHNGLTVMADQNRLVVETEANTYENLTRAVELILKAADLLPVTPVIAAGVNIYHPCRETDIERIHRMWTDDLDSMLAADNLKIVERVAIRKVAWQEGFITFRVVQSDEEQQKHQYWFNFERRSDVIEDLRHWLRNPINDIGGCVDKIENMISHGVNNE